MSTAMRRGGVSALCESRIAVRLFDVPAAKLGAPPLAVYPGCAGTRGPKT